MNICNSISYIIKMSEINEVELNAFLEKKFSARLSEFESLILSDAKEVLSLQEQQYLNQILLMTQQFQKAIEKTDENIEKTNTNLLKMKKHKDNRTHRLYTYFAYKKNKLRARVILNKWIEYHHKQLSKRKTSSYIEKFYRRGLLSRSYKAWKNEAQKIHKVNVNQSTMNKIQNEVHAATVKAFEEAELLKTMVKELTEDLRTETIAKNNLKYKFEQALLRGMSALNLENINIHQEILSQTRSFTKTSRVLLYTPEKLNYLTKS
jgi:hypothetical protein